MQQTENFKKKKITFAQKLIVNLNKGQLIAMKKIHKNIGMGLTRFVLALMVVFSHVRIEFFINLDWAPGSIGNYHAGSVAVVNFFAISGMVMVSLWKKHFDQALEINLFKKIRSFYIDRLIRLFPLYFFYLAATIVFFAVFNNQSSQWQSISPRVFVLNLLMLPMGFNMFIDLHLILEQAWSLGLELTFYALIPFLVHKWNWSRIYILGYSSMVFFILPYLAIINPVWYGYQLLPGVFFIFTIGMVSVDENRFRRTFYLNICRCYSVVLLLIIYFDSRLYELQFNKEVLLGAFLATWIIPNLASTSGHIDTWLGNLSYGVFLNHLLIATLMEEFIPQLRGRVAGLIVLVTISIVLAGFSYLVIEKRVMVFRRSVRNTELNRI